MLKAMDRPEFLKRLNSHFTEDTIRATARRIAKLPAGAELGRFSELLGIIPQSALATWHAQTGRVPVLMARALASGIREHLKSINESKGSRYAGPKALRFNIIDGPAFGLRIAQQPKFTKITIVMRNKPFKK